MLNNLKPLAIASFKHELAISWSDGWEQFLSLKQLRRVCPCALCSENPDILEDEAYSQKFNTSKQFQLQSYDFVGAYGISFRWADGHSTGIYSYQLLRSLSSGGYEDNQLLCQ